MRVAYSVAHVVLINNTFNILLPAFDGSFCVDGLESFLAALAITPSVRISTDAGTVLVEVWHGMRIALGTCSFLVRLLSFEAEIVKSFGGSLADDLVTLGLLCRALQRVATMVVRDTCA